MEEASHPGPPKNLLRLRRAPSTRAEPREVVISDVDSTVGDSDDDAPLVCSPREALGVQGMPITVGGRFASLVEAGDECEEFDFTIADDVEESSVEVRAPDTDLEVATTAVDRRNSPSTSLLDALDHDLAMEDDGQVGGDVDNAADSESDIPAPRNLQITPAIRDALLSMDEIDLVPIFKRRPCLMKSPPNFLKGPYRSAMRLALTEVEAGHRVGDEARTARAWKLFLLLPRILLHRSPRGGKIPKGKLLERFTDFSRGQWIQMLITSLDYGDQAMNLQTRRRRTQQDSVERRADRAEALLCKGELSAGRQALEGAPVAPANDRTLRKLRNPVRRPPQLRALLSLKIC